MAMRSKRLGGRCWPIPRGWRKFPKNRSYTVSLPQVLDTVTFEILFAICLGVLAILAVRARLVGQPWRLWLGESAMMIALTGFNGAQAFLGGWWADGVGTAFVVPGVFISLTHMGSVLLARHDVRVLHPLRNDGTAAERLLQAADVEDLRDRRAAVVRTVRRVLVAPGVVIGISGLVWVNAPRAIVGAGLATLGFLVAAGFRKRAEAGGPILPSEAGGPILPSESDDEPKRTELPGQETI